MTAVVPAPGHNIASAAESLVEQEQRIALMTPCPEKQLTPKALQKQGASFLLLLDVGWGREHAAFG